VGAWDDRRVSRLRTVTTATPDEVGKHDGLAYSLWVPAVVRGGVLILHGAGSCKESHHDFARAARGAKFAAIAFDQRGHGESDGRMDGRALDDVSSMVTLLRSKLPDPGAPIALRGTSMGGYTAIVVAAAVGAAAVVAICPASAEGLRRGLRAGKFDFEADVAAVDALLAANDLHAAARSLSVPLMLMHAEGDEQVPVQHSRELAEQAPGSRLIVIPGGHHRSVQHDDELQAVSLRFIQRTFRRA
jgi:pimeloyl-ACP methyl ester carboxylesterase